MRAVAQIFQRPLRSVFSVLLAALTLLGFAASDPSPAPAAAAPQRILPKRIYQAIRLAGAPPRIDGRLDDACWAQGAWSGEFTQREPHEGQPGSQPTQLKILYDDRYVYVALRAFDRDLATLPRLRGKRDEFTGDIVGVNFDSYFDKRTGFEFDLTSGGSKIDLLLRNDGWDTNWNAVWDGKVGTEAGAWVAEFRIPFSQLRYGRQREQIWGLHSWRWINRLQEESDWQLLPMDSPGLVYSFGELHGIADLPAARRIEILPYVLAKYSGVAREPGNPYRQGGKSEIEGGLDAKIGLTSNFTADLTVNPDFGQVEADPSEINLTTYETFFSEKRPFFLEGKNIFDYGIEDDVLFYSRRIGHAPSYDPPTRGFKDVPTSTRILGAAKVTGKTPAGLSLGILQGFTDREIADVNEGGIERHPTVEPLTSYTVARVQQDFDKGASQLGVIATATARTIHDDALTFLPENAYAGGFDLLHTWSDRTYFLKLQGLASRVDGTATAIRTLMLNPVHNFQRADADHLGVVDGATHLDGTGGEFRAGRDNNGLWRYYVNVDWRSPGLELNDLGYLRTADLIRQSAMLRRYDSRPGRWVRHSDFRLEEERRYDWSGEYLRQDLELHGEIMSNRNWVYYGSAAWTSDQLDTRVLRGGPALRIPGFTSVTLGGQTDAGQTRQFGLEATHADSVDGRTHFTEVAPKFSARFRNMVGVEAKVVYSRDTEDFQYAATAATAAGASRYVMGRMNQHTLSTTLRLDFNLSPELTLSYYGSPFVSTGTFDDFKLVTDPRATRYGDRFRRLAAAMTFDPASGHYRVSDAGGDFAFGNPNFSWRELRSNLVLRWEYQTGSTAYLVWTQNRSNGDFLGDFAADTEYRRLFRAHPDNTILVKFSYWFAL